MAIYSHLILLDRSICYGLASATKGGCRLDGAKVAVTVISLTEPADNTNVHQNGLCFCSMYFWPQSDILGCFICSQPFLPSHKYNWGLWVLTYCFWSTFCSLCQHTYSWIGRQIRADKKSIYQRTRRATTLSRPQLESSRRGESKSALTIFV